MFRSCSRAHRPRWSPLVLLAALVSLTSCGEEVPPTGPPPSNQPPVANAGADQTVSATLAVILDGSASTDPDGGTLSYTWTLTDRPVGSSASLDNGTTEDPIFVPDEAGTYVVQLVVSDGTDDSAPDVVTIVAEDNSNEQTVGAAGGAIASADGSFSLTVPAGALTEDAAIRITTVLPAQFPAELEEVGAADVIVFDLQPNGLQFSTPATIEMTIPGVAAEDGASFEVEPGIAFLITEGANGREAEPVELVLSASRGESEATFVGEIEHFSQVVTISRFVEISANAPETAQVDEPFNVEVTVTPDPLKASIEQGPAQTDASSSPVEASPGFSGAFTSLRSENEYRCAEVGTGTYGTEVELAYSLAPTDKFDLIGRLFVPNVVFESRVTLETAVECEPAPAPPPGQFESFTATLAESLSAVYESSDATVYAVAREGGVSLFDDDGLVLREVLQPGGAFAALVGMLASTGPLGDGHVFGFGPDGIYGTDPQNPFLLSHLQLSVPGVTDNATSVTDGIRVNIPIGFLADGPATSSHEEGRVAFAQFEDRNVLFLDPDGSGGYDVVPELADAFVQNGVSIFGDDRPISLWVGPDGFDEDHPMLVLTIADDTFGDLNIVSLENGVAVRTIVPDYTSIIEPRRLRCDDLTGICGMSSFRTTSFGGIYAFRWDGQQSVTPLSPRLSFAPVGIDVVNTGSSVLIAGTDTKRFVNGAFQNEFRVVEYDLGGALQRSAAFLVPAGCVEPFHIAFRRRVTAFDQVLISCHGDQNTDGVVVSATFELPSG